MKTATNGPTSWIAMTQPKMVITKPFKTILRTKFVKIQLLLKLKLGALGQLPSRTLVWTGDSGAIMTKTKAAVPISKCDSAVQKQLK